MRKKTKEKETRNGEEITELLRDYVDSYGNNPFRADHLGRGIISFATSYAYGDRVG